MSPFPSPADLCPSALLTTVDTAAVEAPVPQSRTDKHAVCVQLLAGKDNNEVTLSMNAKARKKEIRSTAMPLAVDQHNMALLRLPPCQNVEPVIEWLVTHRAVELCRSAGGANLRTHQLTAPGTAIT
jgi:hypothetical protein